VRFWGKGKSDQDTGVSADFQRALMQEVMKTELLRIKALIATTALLAVILWTVYFFASEAVSRVWHGNLKPEYLYSIIVPFVLFELWVHSQITRHMQHGRDLPVVRRYIGALIETSMPTVALALHINSMGSVAALGFVAPMTYFIFIILSTLRLDFWLSTFTGAVAAVQLFGMAVFYHPAIGAEAEPLYYHAARSLIVLICGVRVRAPAVKLRKSTNMTATRRMSLSVLVPSAIRRSTTCGETCWPNKLVMRSRAVAALMLASNSRRNCMPTAPASTPQISTMRLRAA